MPTVSIDESERMLSLSVVVPIRNEAKGIIKCIDSIVSQKFQGNFDIIIVDDHSTDGTVELVMQNYDSIPSVRLLLLSEQGGQAVGKKAALTIGISEAKGDIVVTTDGDCVYSSMWLTTLRSCFDDGVQVVTGPVIYPVGAKMLQGFQALDLLSLVLATVAGISSRNYFLGNGANMAFKNSAFATVNGYTGNEEYMSGDDLFLIQKIAEHFGDDSICYAKSYDAAVLTWPSETMGAFLNQRMRWASKNDALSGRRVYYLWIFLWAVNASSIALLILGVVGAAPLLVVGVLLYLKMLLEGIALYQVSDYFKMKGVMRWFPWAFFLNIVYVVTIGLMAVFAPAFKWKGRSA